MKNTPNQDISHDVPALPYEVFEIKATPVFYGRKVPFIHFGIAETGKIQQAMADILSDDSQLGSAIRNCLESAPNYKVRSIRLVPDIQSAESLRCQLLAKYPLMLNRFQMLNRGNSAPHQHLQEIALEVDDSESGTKRCASCGVNKEHKEFNKSKGVLRDDCKLCLDEANLRGLTPSAHRERRINGWALPPRRFAAASKKCYCCGKVKERKDFGSNKRTRDLLNPSCNACTSEKNRRGIPMKDLRDEKQRNRARRQCSSATNLKSKKHRQTVQEAGAVTYTVYEIVTKIVLWDKELTVSYIGMTSQEVKRRMIAHKSQKAPGNAPLSHSLNSGAVYELRIIDDTKSDKEEAKAIEKEAIISREWVFNKKHTSKSKNSVYDRYILEYKPTVWKKPR